LGSGSGGLFSSLQAAISLTETSQHEGLAATAAGAGEIGLTNELEIFEPRN
jgi:hypothetical protein